MILQIVEMAMVTVCFGFLIFFLVLADGEASSRLGSSRDFDSPAYLKLPGIRRAEENLQSHSVGAENVSVLLYLEHPINVVNEGYLSVTLDAYQVRNQLKTANLRNASVISTAKGLAPAVFRIGGTDGDYAIFNANASGSNYTLTTQEWDEINEFVSKVGWHLVFGLNLQLRKPWPIGAWDSSNAVELMKYSTQKGYNISWELGNGEKMILECVRSAYSVPAKRIIIIYYTHGGCIRDLFTATH